MWWIKSDPCGLFSANFTIGLVVFALFVVNRYVLLPWYDGYSLNMICFSFVCVMSIISHCRAQFTNPGAIPNSILRKDSEALQPIRDRFALRDVFTGPIPRLCRKCNNIKPVGAHHCSLCGRCIARMDHHCPWVNNCVAVFNQKYFILFLIWTAVACVYALVLFVLRFFSCNGRFRSCNTDGISLVLIIIVVVEAIIFGLFTIIMFFDQISAIFDNTPGIDALQNRHGEKKGRYESLVDVFGEPLSWRWFFPTSLPLSVFERFKSDWENARDIRIHFIRELKKRELELEKEENNKDFNLDQINVPSLRNTVNKDPAYMDLQ